MANQAFFDIFGVERQEALEQDHETSADPDLTPGEVTESELQLKKKDGTPIWCSVISRAVLKSDGEVAYYDCVVRDITESRRAEQSIWAADPWERFALNALQEAVLVFTLDRSIVSANSAAEQMFGYTQAELSRLSPESFYADKYPEVDKAIQALLERGEEMRFSIEACKKDGEIFPTEHTLRLIRNSDWQPVAILSMIRDLTERKPGLTGRLRAKTLSTSGLPSSGSGACTYLGLFDDSKTHHSYPSESNYCHAKLPPMAIEPAYQASTCQSGNWCSCLSYNAALKRKT
jgi:PAS domain S-box-containing protein